ncbi:MAG: ABC transporter ATP-binding protein [Bacilli bacterium]|nr:ABC transporter ATP-binding protein [Bacilli bacterium]
MIKLLKNLDKKELLYAFICLILVVIQVWLDLKLPDYMSEITRIITTEGSINDILIQGMYMLLCAFGSLVSAFLVGYFASYIGTNFARKIRGKVFNQVEKFGMGEMKSFSTASLITRTTNDVTQVQMFIAMGLQAMIKAPILATWAVLKIVNKNFTWSLVTAGAIVILLIMILTIVILALPKFKVIQKLTDNLNKITRENLTGIRVVRAFNAEKYEEKLFKKANDELTNTSLFTSRVMAIIFPVMSFIMPMLTLFIYFIGAYLINDAGMLDKIDLFSSMVVFSSYSMQIIMAFMLLTMIFIIYPRASVSAKRILEVIETKPSVDDSGFSEIKTKEVGTIEFKNVSFKYPDALEYMLSNISFEVKKGETVAFIGSTGSGKSTLLNLIPRFYDATEGSVLVDGVDVRNYKLEDLNNKLGYISQKAVLFKGTIDSNVKFGKSLNKIDRKKIDEALEVAQAKNFVSQMDNKSVSQSGTNLSGGQKQRVSIARAIARDPEIYLFDDSFSALDYKTDHILRKELKKYTKNATTIIVAQRIGTILNADKIIVLDDGKIVGNGTHKELLNNCSVYKEIAYSQLSKEELENA